LALAPGVEAVMPPTGFLYLKLIPEPLAAEASADFGDEEPFAGAALPLFEPPAFLFCRSRRVSSAFVFPLVPAFGSATDDLRCGGMADFGVNGLVAAWRGSGPGLSGPGLAEDERP